MRTVPSDLWLEAGRNRSSSASNFATQLEDGKPFTQELQAVVAKVKKHAEIEANAGEHRGEYDLPEEQIRWLTTQGYVARPLEGIWATAPYLHNGSVPTLDDLLKPEDERPICFPVGHREYDPVKLGYVSEFTKVPPAEHSRFFVYDTRIAGNCNRGHRYGTQLVPMTGALLEYLKVMDPPDTLAQKSCAWEWRTSPLAKTATSRAHGASARANEWRPAEARKPVDAVNIPSITVSWLPGSRSLDNVPEKLRVGLFREPKTYTAVIRFSNTGEQDDRVRDNHGMAIKVLGVKPTGLSEKQKSAETQTQDFVLLTIRSSLHQTSQVCWRSAGRRSRWCWRKG